MTNATTMKKRLLTLVITCIMLCMSAVLVVAAEEISSITIKVKSTGDLSLPEVVAADSQKYEVKEVIWSKTDNFELGEKITGKVTVVPKEGYEIVISSKSYSKKIKVTGDRASYRSATKDGSEMRVTINYRISGQLEIPDEAWWDEEHPYLAVCEEVDEARRYEFVLYRENKNGKLTKIVSKETTKHYQDFASELAKYYYKHDSKPEDYEFYFKVRAISGKSYVEESDYLECDEAFDGWYELWYYCYYNNISIGDNDSYYPNNSYYPDNSYYPNNPYNPNDSYYPNTSYGKNGWSLEGNTWYYYENGRKKTGWLLKDGYYYYLDTTGAMKKGWFQDRDGLWYYLNPYASDLPEGAMRKGWFQDSDGRYYFLCTNGNGTKEGAMVTNAWHIGDGSYYFYPGAGTTNGMPVKQGEMARNVWIDGYMYGADGKMIR